MTTSSINNLFGNAAAAANGQDNSAIAGQSATQAPTDANRDMFTKLLVAQIQNQDPLSPQDPTTYVNQLSQLSQTEAIQNMSQSSTANASMLQSLQTLAMGGQVGSTVTVSTGTVQVDANGSKINGNINLNSASDATSLVLTGADGQHHVVQLGAHGSGAQNFTIDPAALGLPPGSYSIQAQPSDGGSPQIEVAARLDSVRVANGSVVLQVANVGQVDPSAVTGFNGKSDGA
ncbi:flagellar hook capping FlgD N-terminal domain-containing protein [Massilia sp. 9096]|uniref:flagellar hook capping FlgD N-terminal domain-containing protein n=1 Tax=Massilia sp. 9096 TaxID=1500894 RepID=UPI0005600B8E|nr:flagellar hook capping FlgD N-terminal domain-containing protein [Massilia sp. 9096]